jgi:hypothetical protein
MQRLAQTVHLSCTETNIVSKRTKTRFYMTHVNSEFHRVCLKWFLSLWYVWCKPCTYLASRLPPFQTEWNRHPLEPHHLGVPSGASKMIYEPMICFTQTMYLSWTDTNNISKRTETRFHMAHITRVPSGASKMISESMVHSAQTVHLSCVKVVTISKRTGLSFHLSLIA